MKKYLFWLRKAEEGFSMLELLIYVGIVGVIAPDRAIMPATHSDLNFAIDV